jgi:hypothetical protein
MFLTEKLPASFVFKVGIGQCRDHRLAYHVGGCPLVAEFIKAQEVAGQSVVISADDNLARRTGRSTGLAGARPGADSVATPAALAEVIKLGLAA